MAITDVALNPLVTGSTGQMLGWTDPEPSAEALPLDMYRFILGSIRKQDEKGTEFLRRYLQGPQANWEAIQDRIFALKDLWDIAEIEDEFLPYLQNIVGWTSDLSSITDALDSDTLRRLIATSVALWRQRGPEDTLIDVLQLTTGAQARIWNWFDFRWVLDETQLGEEHQGRDPWMIELPGHPDADEYRSNVRIVDDGLLNHTLVEDLVKLMRPCGERYEVSYIDFMDRFMVDDADAYWLEIGASTLVISDGTAKLEDVGAAFIAETAVATFTGSLDWNGYVAYFRLRGTAPSGEEFGCGVYVNAAGTDGYLVSIDLGANAVKLYELSSSTPSLIATGDFTSFGTLYSNIYYGLRVHIETQGSTNLIQVYLDADLLISQTDNTHVKGSLSIWHEAGGTVELDEVEMFTLPLETELIDVNS